jgi:hypothetical protein
MTFFVTMQCKHLITKIVAILECAIKANIIDLTKKKYKYVKELNMKVQSLWLSITTCKILILTAAAGGRIRPPD